MGMWWSRRTEAQLRLSEFPHLSCIQSTTARVSLLLENNAAESLISGMLQIFVLIFLNSFCPMVRLEAKCWVPKVFFGGANSSVLSNIEQLDIISSPKVILVFLYLTSGIYARAHTHTHKVPCRIVFYLSTVCSDNTDKLHFVRVRETVI
jgi:hypothetical protein